MEKNTLIAVVLASFFGAATILGLGEMIYQSANHNKNNLVEMVKNGADPIKAHCAIYGSTNNEGVIKPECMASVFTHQENVK